MKFGRVLVSGLVVTKMNVSGSDYVPFNMSRNTETIYAIATLRVLFHLAIPNYYSSLRHVKMII